MDTSASLVGRSINQETAVGSSSSLGNVTATPPLRSKKDLRPGDILVCLAEEPAISELVIQYGQAIPKLKNKKLDNKAIHARIWIKSPDSKDTGDLPSLTEEKEVAEAIPLKGVQSRSITEGRYKVFRSLNENLGEWAAQVASMWSDKSGNISYSNIDAALSAVRRSSYGSKAKKELEKYATDAFTNSPAWKNKGAFCSQFVIAAYQGAFQNISKAQAAKEGKEPKELAPPQGMLASRARTTTPATLEYVLRNDKNFMFLGILEVDDPDYPELVIGHPTVIDPA